MMNRTPGAVIIEGHVQGLSNVRSLGEKGIPVIVVDKTNCIARYSKFCKKFRLCPDFSGNEFGEFLIDLAKTENIKDWVLIPSNDHAVHTISSFKSELEEYYKIITPPIETIDKIYDKARLIELAVKLRVPTPKTMRNDIVGKSNYFDGFPALIKGRHGLTFYKTFGKKAFLVENENELRVKLSEIQLKIELSDTITQELLPSDGKNKTISFTAFVEKGEIHTYWMGEKLREHPIQFGTATFCRNVEIQSLLEPSMALMKSIQYTGVCEIEYLQDPRDEKYKLIEINPRTWLWVGLAKACGVNYASLIYNHFHGNNVFIKNDMHNIDIAWSNYITDFVFSLKGLLKRKLKLRDFIESYKGNVIRAIHDPFDIKPGIVYLLQLIKYNRTR